MGASARGFTLLEVLVALIIFAVAFGAIANLFQMALRQSSTASEQLEALALAERQIARVGADLPLELGESGGVAVTPGGDSLTWRSRIQLAEHSELSPIALYRVTLDVIDERSDRALVTLETLKTGARR